jgi:uncharacterized membrane protein
MALITCPDCNNSVSPYSAACPYCGRPLQPAAQRPPEQPTPSFTEKPASPFTEQPARPYAEQPVHPYGEQPASPYGAQPAPPYGAQAGALFAGQPPRPYGAQAMNPYAAAVPVNPFAKQKSDVQLVYALYAGSFVFGPLGIVALVLSYIRKNEVRGTWMEPHYLWVIDTFWMSLGVGFAGVIAALVMIMVFFPMGFLVMMAVVLFAIGWPIYRLIVGWTALNEGRTPVGRLSGPRW